MIRAIMRPGFFRNRLSAKKSGSFRKRNVGYSVIAMNCGCFYIL